MIILYGLMMKMKPPLGWQTTVAGISLTDVCLMLQGAALSVESAKKVT
jgi:hypothetical protein